MYSWNGNKRVLGELRSHELEYLSSDRYNQDDENGRTAIVQLYRSIPREREYEVTLLM